MARDYTLWYAVGATAIGGIALYFYLSQRAQAQPAPNGGAETTVAEQQVMLQIYGEATSRAQNPTAITFDDVRTHMLANRRHDLRRLVEIHRQFGQNSEEFRGAVADFVKRDMHNFGLVPRGENDSDRIPWKNILPELYTSRNKFPDGRNFRAISRLVHQPSDVYEGAGHLIAGAR